MDPNLFSLDWARVAEVLATIVVLSFILERALSIVVTHRWYVKRFNRKGLKTPLAFALAAYVCVVWNFDALSMIVLTDAVSIPGMLITAAVIAGGSQGSLKLFREVLNIRPEVEKEIEQGDTAHKEIDRLKRELNNLRAPASPAAGGQQ